MRDKPTSGCRLSFENLSCHPTPAMRNYGLWGRVYGGRELPLKILKFVGIIFVNFFLNFDLLLFFFYKIKASESEM